EPDRTDTNIRYYSNDDLKRILNISQLNKNGFKISVIAGMKDSEINEKVSAINLVRTESEDMIDNLIVGMIDMNEAYFEKIFTASILRIGFENTIQKVIFPFFHRIGIMWQTGGINPAQEHFVSNIIRQKLIVAIDGLSLSSGEKKTKSAVLFLPENELHEMSLLFYNYTLRARNIKTVYLGQSVPTESLTRIVEIVKPDFLVGVVTNPFSKKELEKFLLFLSEMSVRKIFLSGKLVLDYKKILPSKITIFKDLAELIALIQK
ncbi:MAG: B12-binding domain-containing protein, partial [Bacteroidota bacterium]